MVLTMIKEDIKCYSSSIVKHEICISDGYKLPEDHEFSSIEFTRNKIVNVGAIYDKLASDNNNSLVVDIYFNSKVECFAATKSVIQSSIIRRLNESAHGKHPFVFVKVTYPDITYTAFCRINSIERNGFSVDTQSIEFNFELTNTPVDSDVNKISVTDN